MNFLLLYDDPADRARMIQTLQAAFPQATISEIAGRRDFEETLAAKTSPVVITDSRVSWAEGLSILQLVKTTSPATPALMVTGSGNEELAVAGMKAGLNDYLRFSQLSQLPEAVRQALNQTQPPTEEIQRLRQIETQYRLFSELISDDTFSVYFSPGEPDKVEWATEAFSRKIGYSIEELARRGGWQSIIHPDDLPRLLAARAQLLTGQTIAVKYRILTREGITFWSQTLAQPVWDETHQRVIAASGINRDITRQKQAEEKYEETETRFRALIEQLPVITYMFDLHEPRGFQFISPHFETLSGYTQKEWHEDRSLWVNSIHPEDWSLVRATFERSLTTPEPFICLYRMLTRDGRTIWLRDHARTIFDEQGKPQMILGVALDITAHRQAEADRQRLLEEITEARDRLKTLSRQLITTQEHERQHIARELHDQIGQALTVLKLNFQACYKKDLGDELKERVEESVRLIDTTIEQVRHLSLELRPSILDDLGLVSALRWYLDRQARRAGITIHFLPSNQGSRLPAEIETTCFRVVQEALTNIIRHAQAQTVFVELREEVHELHLHIRDDGTGFDLTAAAGTLADNPRLGLLSMQERVQLAGGQFRIESAPARGTKIFARFQLLPRPEPPSQKTS